MSTAISVRRLAHVALGTPDPEDAARRWQLQFGLSEAERADGRVRLRCAYEPFSLEFATAPMPRLDRVAYELRAGCGLEDAAAHCQRQGVKCQPSGDGALRLTDPDGTHIELLAYRPEPDTRPPVARHTPTLPAFRPRRIGHVNLLSPDVRRLTRFYVDVLGMGETDRLDGGAASWLHVDRDHHALAIVAHDRPALHHVAFELADWGELRLAFDHLAQHGRWLSWGPVRHAIGQNLCGYVRLPEQRCLVELFCDMEQLEPDHLPRDWPDTPHSSNVWGILPPRSYFRFDDAAVQAEREQLEARGLPLPPPTEVIP